MLKLFSTSKRVAKAMDAHQTDSLTSIQEVGVLVDAMAYPDLMQPEAQDQLKSLGKNTHLMFYTQTASTEANSGFFTKSDLRWNGTFKPGSAIVDFLSIPFDLLIGVFEAEKDALVLASISAQAKFRAGLPLTTYSINDLSIAVNPSENLSLFLQEINKYTQQINQQ